MTFDEKINKIDQLFEASKQNIHGPADFKAILEKFTFDKEEMTEHLLYPEDLPYGRKCAFQSPNFEVVVMNWKPNEQSNIHDHANSFGCVYSVSGKANNVLYNGNLDEIACIPLVNNTIAEVPKGVYHIIENKNDDFAVSLHFYAPPMDGMKVIDKEDKTKNYFVKNECGAWNPKPEEVLVA
jgi:cysteine dioxygenase